MLDFGGFKKQKVNEPVHSSVLRAVNTEFAAEGDVPKSFSDLLKTFFLSESKIGFLAEVYMRREATCRNPFDPVSN
jgi:uncharacterized protein (UPF0332 family)